MRFYDLDSGEITIDGVNIKDFTKSTLRGFVGVVPQEPILFNNTIAYNIGYGFGQGRTLSMSLSEKGPTLSEIRNAAKLANIDDFIESLKKKYDTEVGERGVKLSGSQKQRLAIARMILSDPDIVVFDEATSHLDSENEKLIQDAFWKARRGKTTIIIAHRLSTIMRADKIVVMEHGHIKETGTHSSWTEAYSSLDCIPSNQSTASFLYLLSPLELMRIAGSFPRLPHLLIVKGETRRTSATSRTVRRSGRFSNLTFFFGSSILFMLYILCSCTLPINDLS
ncbi:MAG: ABC-type transport system involved in Fe-S cluster assembly, permease and ATPase component [Candidatus Woesebacteria bacterium GW2011_GWA2_40_7]|uniref:ABC-type transport system involved in Fe-S cluster assembly, permease and ATPase component n=3 Tax=Candidatus Woeseibacteriota TaxID=1752722 RepID=A0A0G0XWZ6_9BACT|nr:MAG: ABC-type transport system involved in Fe-S cluster assembly, permease and ATPase component [Candidatus Woesebacteria bacterium GW2011_GWB1_39_10]KKR73396.1 MAG: ABC-type transport system involved in Fe-S cluster assembly, permease and ATPase component [Candidatus Woesebacteria bacterium GW2011_GWA2_40_7]KKR92437.1 MAG: ABC-type transport system involved in Fe-S cluster assembly, permease and ATPase component [Candidatus Woesebacteria bacterium GW2011_GWA1_41_13b]